MAMKRLKTENKETLVVSEVFYAKRFDLNVNKKRCKGCRLCLLACPREAITLKPIAQKGDGVSKPGRLPPVIDIDEKKCDFHAICAAVCPFSAIAVRIDETEKAPAVDKEAFPVLIRDIEIDTEKCEPDCRKCEEKCPLEAISVKFEPLEPAEIINRQGRNLPAAVNKTVIEVKKDLCATCKVCEAECPAKVIKVNKFIEGSVQIIQSLCPSGCKDCLGVCPVGALYQGQDNKVYVNELYCIYCGACQNVCPQPEALKIARTSFHHTGVKSGAWNKALEKLTSTGGLERELAAHRQGKAREAIKKLGI
jgi:4Fe-4S ferredoxin